MTFKLTSLIRTGALIFVLLFLIVARPVYASSASMFLNPSAGTFSPGSSFSIKVMESSDEPVNVVQAVIQYPEDKLKVTDIDGSSSAFDISVQSSGSGGVIRIVRATPSTDVTGTQLIAVVEFKVLASGTASVSFTDESRILSTSSNSNILKDTRGGKYTLKDQPASSKSSKKSAPSNGSSLTNPSSSSIGSNKFTNEAYFASKHDFNDSGYVDIFDLTLLLNYCFTTVQKYDINGDGIVNNVDISILLRNYGK